MFMVVIVIFKAVDASFVHEVESWVSALMKVMVANHKCDEEEKSESDVAASG